MGVSDNQAGSVGGERRGQVTSLTEGIRRTGVSNVDKLSDTDVSHSPRGMSPVRIGQIVSGIGGHEEPIALPNV